MAGSRYLNPGPGYVCDFLPYRKSNALYRTLAALRPEDWSGTALTNKADDTSRFVECAANGVSTWTPVSPASTTGCEVLARVMLRPGVYGSANVRCFNGIYALINVATGQLVSSAGTVSLPASVWTSSSVYSDCWVRLLCSPFGTGSANYNYSCKVWSVNEAEPTAWSTEVSGSIAVAEFTATAPPALGSSTLGTVSAYSFLSYGVGFTAPAPRAVADANYFDKWLKTAHTAGALRVLTAEIFVPGYDGSSTTNYTTAVLRAATVGYNSGSIWPFDNDTFVDALIEMPEFTRTLPEGIFGRQSFSAGDLVIVNPVSGSGVGLRDSWLRAKLNKAVVTLRYGDPSWPWYDLRTVFTGEVVDVSNKSGRINLTLRDAASRYDKPVDRATIVSSNASNGKPVPIACGQVFNAEPVPVDTSLLTYRCGNGAINAVTQVRDRGVPLTGDVQVSTVESYDTSTGLIRTTAAHGRVVGSVVKFGAAFGGLSAGTQYYVQSVSGSDQFSVAATAGGSAITLTGTTTFALAAVFPVSDVMRATAAHGLAAGNTTRIVSGAPAGAATGTQYTVSATGLTSTDFAISGLNLTATLRAVTVADTTSDYMIMDASHGYAVNAALVAEGTLPAPITDKSVYYRKGTFGGTILDVSAIAGGATVDITGSTTGGTWALNQSGAVFTKYVGASVLAPLVVVDLTAATFQLGANPAGQITCDVQGRTLNGAYSASAAQALKVLLGAGASLVSTVIGSTGVFDKSIGVWSAEAANLADLIDLLAKSCASVWGCNRIGTLTATPFLTGFAATPTATITSDDIKAEGLIALTAKRNPVAYYEGMKVGYAKNYAEQRDADLAGAVTVANRALYSQPWSLVVSHQGGSGNIAGLDNGEKGETRTLPLIETALSNLTDATSLFTCGAVNTPKQLGVFTLTATWKALDAFILGRCVLVKTARYGFDPVAGKNMLVIGALESLAQGTVQLTLLTDLDGYYPVTT